LPKPEYKTAEEKFLIDVGLIAIIIAIWVRWKRNGSGSNGGRAELGASPQKEHFWCPGDGRNSP
jgi:hypothetical protein